MDTQAIENYIDEVDEIYRSGNGTEHSYRPALKTLLETLTTDLTITNEPKHIACGAPDYIITKNGVPLGFVEAKDIPVGIDNKANQEQFDRYCQSLGNLIITDYLSFRLFADGEPIVTITIAHENSGKIAPDKERFPAFLELINRFTTYDGKTICLSDQLAKMMADKAKLLSDVIKAALREKSDNDSLEGQYEGFKKVLLHDLQIDEFADMYAQTLAYGLFAARLNQSAEQHFSRLAAAQLIPLSNPFLRKFFQYIAGFDLDSRIIWIVDALTDLFNCVSVDDIKKEFENANQDPYIHFYETFLAAYNPVQREMRGVYYTPLPVVQFIVQAVDDILKTEFSLAKGIADHSKIKRTLHSKDGKSETVELHKVQILDPATGTGTFLAEVIEKVYSSFANNRGMWIDYCEKHLVPRIYGFEILMASYAMAHFKLDMKLKETGYSCGSDANKRFHVYLTNTLEEAPEKVPELFMARWLADEANEANSIKRDAPVMVVLGNPPYSGESANKTSDDFLKDYKLEPNNGKLREKNPKMINDDYVKFIRYGQNFVEKNGFGNLAYINNHSFLDNLTFRGMRWSLLQTFDTIYILDLHGNARKQETVPDGGKDENVFDIQQGVSINIFIKTGKKKTGDPAEVYHYDLYGRRELKYEFLREHTLASVQWKKANPHHPHYFFVPKDFSFKDEYEKGFSIPELFPIYSSGVKTHDDDHLVGFSAFSENNQPFMYRPFDSRYINYDLKKVKRHRYKIMKHFLHGENVGLVFKRGFTKDTAPVFITTTVTDNNSWACRMGGTDYVAPLYLYPDKDGIDSTEKRRPNLNAGIVGKIAETLGLRFLAEKTDDAETFAPLDILDYIYAVLHSPAYREKYREFLKIDFPRVPYPSNAEQFQKLSALGSVLRGLHLMEQVNPSSDFVAFPIVGTCEIEKLEYKGGEVWINRTQYFENVPVAAWDFYIGGYQPAQKWLKDRKGNTLGFDDIQHYQKIIYALSQTIELQKQIDASP